MTSGIKDPFGKFSVRTRWLTINVVCVTHLELLRKERNRHTTLTRGISGSMAPTLLFRFRVRKTAS